MKVCSRCGEERPDDDFYRRRDSSGGNREGKSAGTAAAFDRAGVSCAGNGGVGGTAGEDEARGTGEDMTDDPRLITTPILPMGTPVMLIDEAPDVLRFWWGAESVLRVACQSPGAITTETDTETGRVTIHYARRYWLTHCHRGRVGVFPESALRVIGEDEARGQELIYREQVREMAQEFGDAIRAAVHPPP